MEKDIELEVNRLFGDKAENVIKLLEEFQDAFELSARVLRCIVFLSGGSYEDLKQKIKEAELDWRDIISSAESTDFQFNKPFNS